jgi:hypothetical protein
LGANAVYRPLLCTFRTCRSFPRRITTEHLARNACVIELPVKSRQGEDAKTPIAPGATITLTIKTAEGKSGQVKFKK